MLVPQAIKDLKAGAKESAKEIDDLRRAGERICASHEANLEKLVTQGSAKIKGLTTKPPPIAAVLKEINKMAQSVQDEA